MTSTTLSVLPFLYRYLKSSDVRDSIPWNEVCTGVEISATSPDQFISTDTFNLKEGEDDVSFFWSPENNDLARVLDVLNELKERRKNFSARSGMMKIDALSAQDSINDPEVLIEFCHNDKTRRACRHHGLYFHTEDSLDRLEVINSLIELSEFFAIRKNKKDDRSILALKDGKYFSSLIDSVRI